ncbi:MAG TPA: hypothetical protein VF241_05145 [Propionibacteriaceae bacterium]
MSSNNPYGAQWDEGGSQPPMPGQGPNVGPDPRQQPSPYRYPQQSPAEYPQQPPAGYPQQPPAGYPQRSTAGSPSSASGYSFGPFAPEQQQTGWGGGPQPGQYGGSPRGYGAAPTRQAPKQPKNRTKILIIIGAAALAVILVAVAVIAATRDKPSADPQGGQNPGGQQTNQQSGAPQNTPRPSDAVAAYLQALAAGDATAALSYSADPAPTGPLLTNEVLAESRNRTQLTGIDVPVVEDQNVKSVSATYTLGSSVVNESFDVVKVAGTWKLSRAVKDLDLAFIVDGPVPVEINGVKVTEESVAVLPGSYVFTTGLPYVGFGSKNVVLVRSPYGDADTYNIQSQLTGAGKKAAISAAKKSFSKCLKAHSLTPKNCPQKFKSKYSYNKSSITWRQAGKDPFRKPSVTFSGTQARVQVPIDLKLSGSCSYQGRSGNCSGSLTGTSVAVIKVTTKPLKVKWL